MAKTKDRYPDLPCDREEYVRLWRERIMNHAPRLNLYAAKRGEAPFTEEDMDYLEAWFREHVVVSLVAQGVLL